MNHEIAQRIARTEDGQALIAYIKASIDSLDTNADLVDLLDDRKIAVEVKARALAQAKLKELWTTLLVERIVRDNGRSDFAVD